jgi:PEP-CTERM motif
MRLDTTAKWRAAILLVTISLIGNVSVAFGDAPFGATVYYGNDAQYGNLIGYTQLRDRWTDAGVPTSITDGFSDPIEGCIFMATAPRTTFSNSQITALQTFISAGGTFIITMGWDPDPMNQTLRDLGSSMQFVDRPNVATQKAIVVNSSHPFVAGLSIGDNLYTFSPQVVTGGTALIDYPIGTHVVSVESVGLGTVMAVADEDMLNNTVGSSFHNDAVRDNNFVFWENIAAACTIPEPSTLLLSCLGMAGLLSAQVRRLRG